MAIYNYEKIAISIKIFSCKCHTLCYWGAFTHIYGTLYIENIKSSYQHSWCGMYWKQYYREFDCINNTHGNTNLGYFVLNLNVQGPSYLGLTRPISWLLMPWLLMSTGHQQPSYWLCRICRSWSWGRILSTCVISIWRKDTKCNYVFIFFLKKIST